MCGSLIGYLTVRQYAAERETGIFYFSELDESISRSLLDGHLDRASDGRDGHGGFRHGVIC